MLFLIHLTNFSRDCGGYPLHSEKKNPKHHNIFLCLFFFTVQKVFEKSVGKNHCCLNVHQKVAHFPFLFLQLLSSVLYLLME